MGRNEDHNRGRRTSKELTDRGVESRDGLLDPPSDTLGESSALGECGAIDESDAEGRIKSGRLAGRSLSAAIAILAGPVFLEQLLAATVGLVDKMLTGGLPVGATAALDGVGIGSYIGWFLGIATSSVGIGAMAIISRGIGSGNARESHLGLGQALLFALGWGVVLGISLFFGAPGLAWVGGLSPEATVACTSYIRTIAFGAPMASLTFVGIMCLHAAGEAVRPFFIMLVVNIVNIITSWFLSGSVIELFGYTLASPGSLGVTGIAIGTAVSRTVGAILILGLVLRGVKDLRLERWALRPHPDMLRRIARVGVPAFLDGLGMWIGNVVVLGVVGKIAAKEALESGLGEQTLVGLVGAHIIAIQWEALSFLPGFAMGTAAAALVGQYLGAKNPRMATRSLYVCAGIAALFMGLAGVALILFGDVLTAQISQDPLHLELAPQLLVIGGVVQVNFALAMVLREGIRGAGDTRWAMIITWAGTWGLRVPLSYLVGYTMGYGLVGVWWVLCGEIVIKSFLMLARVWHGGWKRIRV